MTAWIRTGVLALLWGSTFLWTELALRGFSPAQVTLIRSVLGALTLVAACYLSGHRLPRDRTLWAHLAVAALLCNALPFFLFSLGQQQVDSGLAGVLNATTPLWALAIGLALGTEHGWRPVRAGGLLLGFAGTVLIFAPWQRDPSATWGALAILLAAVSYAVAFSYMGQRLAGRGTPAIVLSAAQLTAAAGWSLGALPAGGIDLPRPDATSLLAVLILGVLCTALTFHLTCRVIADEGAVNASTVGYLLPVVSVALGAVILDERVGPRVLAGMAAVLLGVALTRYRRHPVARDPVAKPAAADQPPAQHPPADPHAPGDPHPATRGAPAGSPPPRHRA